MTKLLNSISKLRVNDPPIEPYAMVTKSRWEVKAKKPLRRSSDEGLKRGRRLRHDDSCNLVYSSSSLLFPSSHIRHISSSRQITERWGRESNPWSESDELWISRENCKVRWWMMNFEFVGDFSRKASICEWRVSDYDWECKVRFWERTELGGWRIWFEKKKNQWRAQYAVMLLYTIPILNSVTFEIP